MCSFTCFKQALSSAYVPIGATLVGPEVADVIYSQSNKLGISSFLMLSICFKKACNLLNL